MLLDRLFGLKDYISQKIIGNNNIQKILIGNKIDIHAHFGDMNAEIDDIVKFLPDQPQVAISFLEKMKNRDGLTNKVKYRIEANIGCAYDVMGEREKAAMQFFQAKDYDPTNEKAQGFEALGYYYLGNYKKARDIANNVIQNFPSNIQAWEIWVLASQATTSFEDLEAAVPEQLRGEENIAFALAQVAFDKNKMDAVERYIRITMKGEIDNPVALEKIGLLLLQQVQIRSSFQYGMKLNIERKRTLEEAENYLNQALQKYRAQNAKGKIVDVLIHRSMLYLMDDEKEKAENDILTAYNEYPENPEAILKYAILQHSKGQLDISIDLLKRLLARNEGFRCTVELILAVYLDERNQAKDREEALIYLNGRVKDLEQEELTFRFDYISCLLDITQKQHGNIKAIELLDSILSTSLLSQESQKILRASHNRTSKKENTN